MLTRLLFAVACAAGLCSLAAAQPPGTPPPPPVFSLWIDNVRDVRTKTPTGEAVYMEVTVKWTNAKGGEAYDLSLWNADEKQNWGAYVSDFGDAATAGSGSKTFTFNGVSAGSCYWLWLTTDQGSELGSALFRYFQPPNL